MSDDPSYYKIIRSNEDPRKLVVACLQSFDEADYDQSRFLSDYKYPSEEDAQKVINGIKIYLAEIHLGV